MIVITGATGHLGKATIDFLLDKGISPQEITAFVRDEAKVEELKNKGIVLKKGDYEDYDSMLAAFHQADKLLLISGTDIANRTEQQERVVKAAKEVGVKHIFYTSFTRKNETESSPISFVATSHLATEKALKASGLPYTILKNSLYSDVLPMFLGEKVLETGIFFPAGEGKAAFTTRSDMAEATAAVLAGTGHENQEYVIATEEAYDMHQIAGMLSNIAGHTVAYANPSAEVYTEAITKAGVPPLYIGMLSGFATAIKQGEFDGHTSDLEKLLGHKPTSLQSYLEATFSPVNSLQS